MVFWKTLLSYVCNEEPQPDVVATKWAISRDAMEAELEVWGKFHDWLIEWALDHAKRRGSTHRMGCPQIDREDIEHGGQHLEALMRHAEPPHPSPDATK